MWAMNHLRNPGSIQAALGLIQSCIHNKEFEDAKRYARHAYFMIADMTDNFIPADEQPRFLADVTYWLGTAILSLAQAGGIPAEEKQKAGEEAIELERKALEVYTYWEGTVSPRVALAMGTLADALDYFNDVDDDEVLLLQQQAITIFSRAEGSLSVNLAIRENRLGLAYKQRARRAHAVNDLDREVTNLELALSHYHEAIRIYRAIDHVDNADYALLNATQMEEQIRQIRITRAESSGNSSDQGLSK